MEKKMKWRFFLAFSLTLLCVSAAFAQNSRSNLAILPFTGGQATEGETVAELFSFDRQLMDRFGVIPRTSITRAVAQEQNFQMSSGMTDADTIVAIGEQLGAQYVMAGCITALGGQKLLVVAIIRIETVQQVAGDYLTYTTEEELAGRVSGMVKNLLPMLDVDTGEMEKLAVLPIDLQSGASARDADTLAQILSIGLIRNGAYAIYPRTATLEKVQQEFDTQLSGVTDYRQAAQLGKAENPRLVLSVAARKLGASDRFNASIIDLEDGIQIQGTSEEYANMSDGITAMDIIARVLSGREVSATERRRRSAEISSAARREETARKRAEKREETARKRAERRGETARKRAERRGETARIRAVVRENFNKNAGLAFAFQGGVSLISDDDLGSEKIFGEPAYATSGGTPGASVEILFGFQYAWFSINTGASIGMDYDGPSRLEYTFLQAPLLFRGDWGNPETGDWLNFNLFAGAAYNIPLKAEATLYGTTQSADLTMSPSILLGIGLGLYIRSILLYMDFRGVTDVVETGVKLEDGRTASFSRFFQPEMTFGIKYRRPFSKSRR